MTQQPVFKIATYNLEVSRRPEKLIKNICDMANNGVSIFCLQEVTLREKEQFIMNKLLKQLGKDWQAEWAVENNSGNFSFGNAIVWKQKEFKKVDSYNIILPKRRAPRPHEKIFSRMIGFSGKPITRRGLVVDFSYQQEKLRVCCVHADVLGGAQHRRQQVRFLLENLQKLSSVAQTIIAGDFNTINIVYKNKERGHLQRMFSEYGFKDTTKEIDWSHDIYQSNFVRDGLWVEKIVKGLRLHFRQKLDYIWEKNLDFTSARRIEVTGSDHLPLVVSFKLKSM